MSARPTFYLWHCVDHKGGGWRYAESVELVERGPYPTEGDATRAIWREHGRKVRVQQPGGFSDIYRQLGIKRA